MNIDLPATPIPAQSATQPSDAPRLPATPMSWRGAIAVVILAIPATAWGTHETIGPRGQAVAGVGVLM